MFPSATSPGNPLLTSVSGETAHMGKRRRSAPARPRKLFPFPSRAAYREERERSSRPRKCRRCSPRRSSARFRPQPPDAPSAAHSRKRGPPRGILGGVARPAPAAILCALSLPGSLWGRLVLAPACLARSSRRPGSTRRALSPLSPGDRGGGGRWEPMGRPSGARGRLLHSGQRPPCSPVPSEVAGAGDRMGA